MIFEGDDKHTNNKELGNITEDLALIRIMLLDSKVQFINDLIDIQLKDKYIEVKSCQLKINDGDRQRYGRFYFDEKQHNFLLIHDGFYFLFVMTGSLVVACKLVKARDIYHKQKVSWKKYF